MTQPFGADAFDPIDGTVLRWLGMAGFLLNSRGTTIMLDPVLRGFDLPLLIEIPIDALDVTRLDAVLITHADNDHYSASTCEALAPVATTFHSTRYVVSLMSAAGLTALAHDIGDHIDIGHVGVDLTPADHAWQNASPGTSSRTFRDEDCCGFWLTTPDGTIWAPGDSRLIPDHHLTMPPADVLLFDFSDSEWHFTLEGAIRIANAYPDTVLVLQHWGSVDAPDLAPFNGNPASLYDRVVNPARIQLLAPGQPYALSRA